MCKVLTEYFYLPIPLIASFVSVKSKVNYGIISCCYKIPRALTFFLYYFNIAPKTSFSVFTASAEVEYVASHSSCQCQWARWFSTQFRAALTRVYYSASIIWPSTTLSRSAHCGPGAQSFSSYRYRTGALWDAGHRPHLLL